MFNTIPHGTIFKLACPGNAGIEIVLTKDGTIFNAEVHSLLSGETLSADYIETLDDLGRLVLDVQDW